MAQIRTERRLPMLGDPPNGIDINVQRGVIDFVVWDQGTQITVRLTHAEADQFAANIAGARKQGENAPRIVRPGSH